MCIRYVPPVRVAVKYDLWGLRTAAKNRMFVQNRTCRSLAHPRPVMPWSMVRNMCLRESIKQTISFGSRFLIQTKRETAFKEPQKVERQGQERRLFFLPEYRGILRAILWCELVSVFCCVSPMRDCNWRWRNASAQLPPAKKWFCGCNFHAVQFAPSTHWSMMGSATLKIVVGHGPTLVLHGIVTGGC